MARFLIVAIIIYIIFLLFKKSPVGSGETQRRRSGPPGEDLVEDPHCHVYIPISDAYRRSYEGKELYFCSKDCFEQYVTAAKEQRQEEAS